MRITRIHIENFRCLRDFTLYPRSGINMLIGENNSGKTAFIQAIDKVLGRGTPSFDLEDFFVSEPSTDPKDLPIIRIDLEIRPVPSKDFSAAFATDFVDEIDFDENDHPFLIYRTEATFDSREGRVRIDYFVIKSDGTSRPLAGGKRFILRGYIPFYRADAFRDTVREMKNRRGYWGRLVDSILLAPATADALRKAVQDINSQILSTTPRLGDIRDRFKDIGRVIATASPPDDIIVNPVSLEPSEILRNLEIVLRISGGPRGFSLDRHGEGTRSIAYLVILRAFVDLLAREENDNIEAEPILGIEEPEVHLHPHSARAIARLLADQTQQTFLTTHSTQVAEAISAMEVILLGRTGAEITPRQVPEKLPTDSTCPYFDIREKVLLERQLHAGAAEVFFAKCVIFCEGDSDRLTVPVFAKTLDIPLNSLGISIIQVGGQGGYGLLIRMLAEDAFGIPWVILSDGEEQTVSDLAKFLIEGNYVTQDEVETAKAADSLLEDILLAHNCFVHDNGRNLEGALIDVGGLPEYESAIAKIVGKNALVQFIQNRTTSDSSFTRKSPKEQILEYLRSNEGKRYKAVLARTVAEKLTQDGRDDSRIPNAARRALERAKSVAEDRNK